MQETPNHPTAQQRGRGYTDSVIEKNKQGALTEQQRQAFIRTHTLRFRYAWQIFLITLIPNYFILFALVDAGVMSLNTSSLPLIAFALSILMAGLVQGPVGNRIKKAWALSRLKPTDTVVPVEGEVVYTPSKRSKRAGRRSARAGGHIINPIDGYTGRLENGAYTFYVVRGTRLFVNAQRHGSLYNEDDYLSLLSDTHGFDLEALTHNRDGILTKAQRRQLTRTGVNAIIGTFVLAIGIIGGLLYAYPGELFVLICTIGIIFIAAGFLIRSLARFNDSSRGTVTSIKGKLRKRLKEIERDTGPSTYTYWYDIDGLSFEVTRDGYGVLEESHEYIIYYTPHGKHIVNIEPVT